MSYSNLSLKRYLFLLIGIFVLLLAMVQIGFITYIQNQIGQEVQDKSRTLSTRALDMLVDNLSDTQDQEREFVQLKAPETHNAKALIIRVEKTPNQVVDLGDGYSFVSGEETQTVTIERAGRIAIEEVQSELRERLHKMNINRVDSAYAFTLGFDNDQQSHQQIIQFNPQDSVINNYFQWLMLATVAICLVGLFLAYWLARHISNPLAELSKGFNQLEKGELGTQVTTSGIQEVKETLRRFNHMSERLAQLKQIENQFAQQQQLAELGDITRGLAHTLRNPINTIGLAIEQISQPGLNEQQRLELAVQARHKINHLDNTIKALLCLTTTGIDRNQRVNINQVIEDIIMEMSMTGQNRIEFSPVQDVFITGAESELRAILHTLISNAVEASQENQPISIFVHKQIEKVQIKVVDEGNGISEQIRDKLFQPHVSSKPEGAGMGLYIARRLCRSYYQGDITLEDNKPNGCIAQVIVQRQQEVNHD